MKGKRTIYEIYWEILTFCRSPRTFTSIIHRCSLNSKIGQEHIDFLISKGYLRQFEEEGRNLHKTTDKAAVFLNTFKEMYLELYNRGPEFKL
ncbi:MAG: winged helix-turn-helix domain-containing protein [Candidatus Bathyarchaeia archaeon]